jgi:hypothetical protein
MLPNMEDVKLAVMITYGANTTLVLTMLLGLLRICNHGGGMVNLGLLLSKQVSGDDIF